jgi:hypothetical protein
MEFTLQTTFEALEPRIWNELVAAGVTNAPFLRHEYLSTWWQTRGGGEWPEAELALITAMKPVSWWGLPRSF